MTLIVAMSGPHNYSAADAVLCGTASVTSAQSSVASLSAGISFVSGAVTAPVARLILLYAAIILCVEMSYLTLRNTTTLPLGGAASVIVLLAAWFTVKESISVLPCLIVIVPSPGDGSVIVLLAAWFTVKESIFALPCLSVIVPSPG